ncbi:UDP-N-acetylmuramoyl-tripeptide--D-alanyl-D-alanine ligase [Algimonas porphyrae]|uniref:UDP-N-acetylmuramoyl-tripeptide--D-alanyl-D-alanine ligase n=1 Tax=Algimonas porphyrae TaxID=1128113 RepID=A0ABQ5UYS8_9PROT|nr:UDP-N-acetylmuramoyl-tripeptide--D-alanyl-D-alanine ligase [Algimonas porphyrae]GLQ20064.1 UDP-N-acetylmuramoyl-tripeptide--D-alanyl-D-alanine ligase [Algimonas porphyrae]
MTVLWTSNDIAAATGGKATADFSVSGLSIDTRSLQPGDLFVPLKDTRDGHDFIEAAFAAGAAGTLSEYADTDRAVHVTHVDAALRALGQAGRARSGARRIAVTGSVGKTSIKDALATILAQLGRTHKSQRSFNNHIGVPITLATLPPDTDFAVFETGMNHAGELTDLSHQVAPHVALITTVAAAHRANFDSVEAIADAKAEIRHGLLPNGTLILNADNSYTPRIRSLAAGQKIVTFGRAKDSDIRILSSDHHADGGTVSLDIAGQAITVSLNVAGEHWASNAAACMAVVNVLGLDLEAAARAMQHVTASGGRGDVHALTLSDQAITLIDESYNANPASMRAAISAAALRPGRKIAVLGDMHELGPDELDLHAALAEPLVQAGFSRVLTIGECMRSLRGALPRAMRGLHADSADQLRDALSDELQAGDVVLLKGSNAAGLGQLVSRLKQEGAA